MTMMHSDGEMAPASSASSSAASVWSGRNGFRTPYRQVLPAWHQGLLGRAGPRQVVLAWALLLLVAVIGLAALATLLRGRGQTHVPAPAVPSVRAPAVAQTTASVNAPAVVATPSGTDGGLRFGALAERRAQGASPASEASDVAWLFGALVSGGRSADAWALLTPEAQRATHAEAFDALLGSTTLLRGSDDAPWRVPGSDTFLFNVSNHEEPASLTGELRVALAMVDGQWRVSGFKLRKR